MGERIRPTLTACLLLATVITAGAGPAGAQDWGNYGGNAGRNGLTSEIGPLTSDILWSNSDDFSIISWHPFILDGRVFTVRESGFPQDGGAAGDAIVAYDLDTGVELWRTTMAFGGDTSTEWIAWIGGARDGRVYASRSSNLQPAPLKAYDAATGALLWTSALSTEAWAHDGIVFAPDGDLIVGDRLRVARIDGRTGATVWNTPRGCPVSGNCGAALTQTGVFIDEPIVGGNKLTKLDLATGAVQYSSVVMPGFTDQNSPFVSPDGQTIYFSRSQNNVSFDSLYAFFDTGASLDLVWSRPIGWTTSHEHGIGPAGSIYTFLQTGEFVRLDPSSGIVLGNAGVLAPLGNPSPKTVVDGTGKVYVSNGWASTPASNGRIWVFNNDLSIHLFTLELDRQNAGGPALGEDGTLVVCDRTGVYAYRTDGIPGYAHCFGEACPCANPGGPGEGCRHSGGAGMTIFGLGSTSIAADDIVLTAGQCPPTNSGIFYSGTMSLGAGNPLFDGLQCTSGNVRRYQGVFQTTGSVSDSGFVAQAGAGYFVPGVTYHFQYWSRDVTAGASPCGTGANFSPAYAVTATL